MNELQAQNKKSEEKKKAEEDEDEAKKEEEEEQDFVEINKVKISVRGKKKP